MKVSLFPTLLLLLSTSPAFAHPSHDGGEPYRPTAPAPAAPPPSMVIPATYPEVVAALRERLTATEAALTAAKIVDLHAACANLKDLATSLPSKTASLPADARATIDTTAPHLALKVAELVASADKGDTAGTKTALTAVKADIDVLAGFLK